MSKMRICFNSKRMPLCVVLAIFFVVILIVNPLREMAITDDWAYALTVRRLIETGHYESHPFTGPNMPFLAYWGALFAYLFGYSFSILRISTLALAFVGLIAFYYLAIEHGLDDVQAGLLTLVLLVSPLVLRLSFSFMTDIPFLACLIISLLLYTRAIRAHSYLLMLLGSIAATAAILTRQVGLALVGGLFLEWILNKAHRQQPLLFLAGFALPAAAGLWQGVVAILRPSWALQSLAHYESRYIVRFSTLLPDTLLWRPMVISQYLALFSLPLVLLGLLILVHRILEALDARRRRLVFMILMLLGFAVGVLALLFDRLGFGQAGFGPGQRLMLFAGILLFVTSWWLFRFTKNVGVVRLSSPVNEVLRSHGLPLGIVAAYILAGILYGHFVKGLSIFLPYIPWPMILRGMSWLARGLLTLMTSLGAAFFLYILIVRYSGGPGLSRVQPRGQLIELITFLMLIQQLIFPLLADRYILVFMPFTLIVTGWHLRSYLRQFCVPAFVACLMMLTVSVMYTRGSLEFEEASWRGAEYLRSMGVRTDQISGVWTWMGYYRFQDYLHEAKGSDINDFFERWLPEQRAQAEFWITSSLNVPADEKWKLVVNIPYKDTWLREKHIYVMRRE